MTTDPHRCRTCTSNDHEALVEHLAERFWLTNGGGGDNRTWQDAGSYWQTNFRRFAATAVTAMRT